MLANPPVLAYPDFELPFVLHTNVSDKGLGAVLYQSQGGKLLVIGYGSRTLTLAEKNYRLHSGKLEYLALKWTVCEKCWDNLFYAPHFTIYTDNNPLMYVMRTAKLNALGFWRVFRAKQMLMQTFCQDAHSTLIRLFQSVQKSCLGRQSLPHGKAAGQARRETSPGLLPWLCHKVIRLS